MSTPMPRRSASAPATSSSVSPRPRIRPLLVVRPARLGPRQHGQAAGVVGRWADGPLEAGHRLHVVVQHVGPGVEDRCRGPRPTLAVGDQDLDGGPRLAAADGSDRLGERGRPAVGEVVARHGRDDRVVEAHAGDGFGDPLGLVVIELQRLGRVDQAEPAGPGATLAVDHERGRAVGPALEDVRAAGVLADRDQLELAHRPLEPEVVGARCGPWPAASRACARRWPAPP